MGTDATIDRVKKELLLAFDNTRAELDRIEILAAGLAAFNAPIPGYEPTFRHLPQGEPGLARARRGRAENLSLPEQLAPLYDDTRITRANYRAQSVRHFERAAEQMHSEQIQAGGPRHWLKFHDAFPCKRFKPTREAAV